MNVELPPAVTFNETAPLLSAHVVLVTVIARVGGGRLFIVALAIAVHPAASVIVNE